MMSLEASAQMPSDCKDCLIHATRQGRESGSQSGVVSAPEDLTRDSGSWIKRQEETRTDPASWGTTPVWAAQGLLHTNSPPSSLYFARDRIIRQNGGKAHILWFDQSC